MDTNKIQHLQMIQNIITRMAGNSFALKGWAVTLIVGIYALLGQQANKKMLCIAYIPILVFWLLDSFYLLQERQFRKLYDVVRQLEESEISFDMRRESPTLVDYRKSVLSITECFFYIPLAIVATIILYYL